MKKYMIFTLIIILTFGFTFADNFAKDNNINDGSNIKNVINNYIAAEYENVKNLEYPDLSNFFNRFNASAIKVCSYEEGRIKFEIESLKFSKDRLLQYSIDNQIISMDIDGNIAKVEVAVIVNDFYTYMHGEMNVDRSNHIFTFIKINDQWLIDNDEYTDEFKDNYSNSTDFDLLIKNIGKDAEKFTAEQKMLENKNANGNIVYPIIPPVTLLYNIIEAEQYPMHYNIL